MHFNTMSGGMEQGHKKTFHGFICRTLYGDFVSSFPDSRCFCVFCSKNLLSQEWLLSQSFQPSLYKHSFSFFMKDICLSVPSHYSRASTRSFAARALDKGAVMIPRCLGSRPGGFQFALNKRVLLLLPILIYLELLRNNL